jgi:D-alanine-D-alanine ligase
MPTNKKNISKLNPNIVVVMGGFPQFEIERRHSIDFGELVVETLRENGYRATSLILKKESDLNRLKGERDSIVFNALIGKFGEDGEFASFLELNNIPFTGCGSLSSSITMDKAKFKLLIHSLGIKTPAFQVIDFELWKRKKPGLEPLITETSFYNCNTTFPKMKLPIFIKANHGGFHIGASMVSSTSQFEEALTRAGEVDTKIVLEEFIEGVDAHVSILNGTPLATIERASITPNKNEFASSPYNFRVKDNYFFVPGRFAKPVNEKLKADTKRAYGKLRLRGLCRADFRVASTGDVFMLEINSQHSIRKNRMGLMAAAASGLEPIALIEEIIENRWTPKN